MAMTESEMNEAVAQVVAQIKNESKSVEDLDTVEDLSNVVSLPAVGDNGLVTVKKKVDGFVRLKRQLPEDFAGYSGNVVNLSKN